MTETEAEQHFAHYLRELGLDSCPQCGRLIDRGDVAWNSAFTEAGTDFSVGEIICQQCDHEIAYWHSWYPKPDTFAEFVEHVLPDLDR